MKLTEFQKTAFAHLIADEKDLDPAILHAMKSAKMVSKRVEEAFIFSHERHGSQTRKYTGEPYIVHPAAVCRIVGIYLEDHPRIEDIQIAALLHDVVEDTPTTIEEIATKYGRYSAHLVDELTNKSDYTDGNRKVRMSLDRKQMAMASFEAKCIRLGDIADNVVSVAKHDEAFAPKYISEKIEMLEVLRNADPNMVSMCERILQDCSWRLGGGSFSPRI